MQSTDLTELAGELHTAARAAHSGRSPRTLVGRHEHRLRQTVGAP